MGYKALTPEDLVISTDSVTQAAWSNNAPMLSDFFTSSIQIATNTGQFYYSVYQLDTANSESAIQFDVAYGDKPGSGSLWYNALVPGASPSRTTYGQYRTLILGDENADFIFGNYTGSYFYALPVERARYKQTLLPGTQTFVISGSAAGVGATLELTDDSKVAPSVVFTDAGRVFNLVSGSAGTVYTGINANGWAGGATSALGSYGWFLPDVSMLIFNAAALDAVESLGGIAFGTQRTSNTNNTNPAKFVEGLTRAGQVADTSIHPTFPQGWTLNSEEALSSDFVFVRAQNNEFNYSSNPSFISGSTGEVIFNSFISNPQTYITTVGLYNDVQELLAVAKLSRPLPKDFTKEMLVRVKLDF
tara:strand:- start:300 stop:1382 length:1083 start_codon:yes stop_codon:yes gene_type:complete